MFPDGTIITNPKEQVNYTQIVPQSVEWHIPSAEYAVFYVNLMGPRLSDVAGPHCGRTKKCCILSSCDSGVFSGNVA